MVDLFVCSKGMQLIVAIVCIAWLFARCSSGPLEDLA